jgi:hypothetical protein
MLQEISRRDLVKGMFGVAGAAGLAALAPEARPAVAAPVAAPAEVAPAVAPAFVRAAGSELMIPVPTSFRPEDQGGMQNAFLTEAPKGKWFHPKTKISFLKDQPHTWSYQYYFADCGNLELGQHAGEEGRLIFRQGNGEDNRLRLGVGTMTEYTDKDGKKHNVGLDIVNPMVNVRTHPFVECTVYNPDNGQQYMIDGQPAAIKTSESGDATFRLNPEGRWLISADIPFDIKLETMVWKGPHENTDINWLDLRSARTAAACGC